MQNQYTFLDLIVDVFNRIKLPMSPDEIWSKAVEFGLDKKLGSLGKTPSATVGSRLYVDVKENGENSRFVQVSKRPSRFMPRESLDSGTVESYVEIAETVRNRKNNESDFNERDLHPLLVKYVKENPHFHCYAKTIYQENSVRKVKGANEWLHPDLVGVYFPFGDYSTETTKLQKSMNVNSIKLFSFEMKKHLDYSNLRQCFFQAVSNSSWANEGYLVCLNINNDSDFMNELQRLSNAFGIGIIKLNARDINDSEIICQARYNESIDWDTLNRLAEDSPDFNKFISDLTEDIALGKVKSNYDKVIPDEKYENYLVEKKIIA